MHLVQVYFIEMESLFLPDPDDPDYRRELMRPADIKEDVKQMEQRKRVSLILNSEAFRRELEEIIESQLKNGPHPASLIALQQISELLLPHSRLVNHAVAFVYRYNNLF